jgi:hypothetical protein
VLFHPLAWQRLVSLGQDADQRGAAGKILSLCSHASCPYKRRCMWTCIMNWPSSCMRWLGTTVVRLVQFVAAADFIRAEATEPVRTYVHMSTCCLCSHRIVHVGLHINRVVVAAMHHHLRSWCTYCAAYCATIQLCIALTVQSCSRLNTSPSAACMHAAVVAAMPSHVLEAF